LGRIDRGAAGEGEEGKKEGGLHHPRMVSGGGGRGKWKTTA
jgi:hypothetical protein